MHIYFMTGIHFMVCNFIQRRIYTNGLEIEIFLIQKTQLRCLNILLDFSWMKHVRMETNSQE